MLQYNLTTPISYQSGDVLGVYQPDQSDSVVRVYYDSNASNTYRVSESNPTSIPNDVSTASDKLILMSPMSGTYEFKLNIIYAVLYFLSQTHPAALVIFSADQPCGKACTECQVLIMQRMHRHRLQLSTLWQTSPSPATSPSSLVGSR